MSRRPHFAITRNYLLTFTDVDGVGPVPVADVSPALCARLSMALDELEQLAAQAEALSTAGRAVLCAQHFGGGNPRDVSRAVTDLENALRGGDPNKPWGPQEMVCGVCGLPAGAHNPADIHPFADPVPWMAYQDRSDDA